MDRYATRERAEAVLEVVAPVKFLEALWWSVGRYQHPGAYLNGWQIQMSM